MFPQIILTLVAMSFVFACKSSTFKSNSKSKGANDQEAQGTTTATTTSTATFTETGSSIDIGTVTVTSTSTATATATVTPIAPTLDASLVSNVSLPTINYWKSYSLSWTSSNASSCQLSVGSEVLARTTTGSLTVSNRVNPAYMLTCVAGAGAQPQSITKNLNVATCARRQTLVGNNCVDWIVIQRWSYLYEDPFHSHFYNYQGLEVPYANAERSPGFGLPLSALNLAQGLVRVRHYYNTNNGDHYYTSSTQFSSPDYQYQPTYDFAWFYTNTFDGEAPLQPIYQWSKLKVLPSGRVYQDHLFTATASEPCSLPTASANCGAELVAPAGNAYTYEGIQGYLYFDR